MKVRLRRQAASDLDHIWDYTADRWGSAQADAYIADLRAVIAALPSGSSDAGNTFPGLHRARSGAHLIYFLAGEGIDVVRILHERQDASSISTYQ